jgi:hypothetical protein
MRRIASTLLLATLAGCAGQSGTLNGVGGLVGGVFSDIAAVASLMAGIANGTGGAAIATPAPAGTADAPGAVAALVGDVRSIVADGALTGTALAQADADLATLAGIAAEVTPASDGVQLSTAVGGITGVLTDLGQLLPDVLPLLSLVDNANVRVDHVAIVLDGPAPAKAHSDPAKIAKLKTHLKALKAAAAAKVAAIR